MRKKSGKKISLNAGLTVSILLILALCFSAACIRRGGGQDAGSQYMLPATHPDNGNPLKGRFFQEPFRDLSGRMVQLNQLAGMPLIISVFPSFKTEDGQRSLVGLEALQKKRIGQFRAVFIPIEDAETIKPVIITDPEGMVFLFRAGENDNLSLVDTYSSFFWNADLIAADFPGDPPERHYTSPFYWVVDSEGNIREKLIDYSDARGVDVNELDEVLEALLGPPPEVPAQPSSVAGPESAVSAGPTEESGG